MCVCVVLCRQQRSRLTASVLTQTEDMDEEGLGAVLERPDDLQTLSRWELVSEVVQLSKERQALCDHISKLEKSHKAATAERGEQCKCPLWSRVACTCKQVCVMSHKHIMVSL